MLKWLVDVSNANPAIPGLILCGITLITALILALDRCTEKKNKARIRQLKKSVETKEILIVHKDKEIWSLKVELFKAREDGKIAVSKKDAEIERLTAKIAQLELDKKQLSKWGTEK